ncbi:hypothetical protein O3P69_017123 [Scylla paramamosain]|uniref:Ig-like domain-containing protein n=1 Tax=Scylla paramamosain TaxID=85552 RepID=A0AAW0TUP5_SCYPA
MLAPYYSLLLPLRSSSTPLTRPLLPFPRSPRLDPPPSSYDGRVPQLLEDIRAENTELKMTREAATLTFTRLALQHAGLYECRVEFFRSPTHTSLVNLTLVEPPRVVEVRDRQKGPPKNGVLGPYEEGVMVVFTCLARDGWPLPNVTWWRGSKMVDGGWEVSGPRLVRNDLVVSKLTRDWHNDTLTCTASNTKLVPPSSVSATIQMYLLPTNVAITGPTTAKEGHRMRLRCTSRGSRPSARLTWTLHGKTVPAEKEVEKEEEEMEEGEEEEKEEEARYTCVTGSSHSQAACDSAARGNYAASSGSKDGGRVGLYVAVNGGQWWQRGAVSGSQRGLWRATGAGDEGSASGFVTRNVRSERDEGYELPLSLDRSLLREVQSGGGGDGCGDGGMMGVMVERLQAYITSTYLYHFIRVLITCLSHLFREAAAGGGFYLSREADANTANTTTSNTHVGAAIEG